MLYTQTGTPYYASPEVWKDLPYDTKSDIWSLGCVMYEALALVPPFRAKDMNGLYKKVIKGHFEDPTKANEQNNSEKAHYSKDLIKLIAMMIRVNPKDRPSCEDLLRMPEILNRIKSMKLTT